VLERPYHLSYPQLFVRDGALFMMPETTAGGALEIYRAIEFPSRWELVARPMLGQFHDATLYDDGRQLWITAAVADRQASTWDTLAVYHAERLDGPWTPVTSNPVLIDARRARPAGELFKDGGRLYRPVQDCSGGYGSALAVCEVTRLDETGFSQIERRHTRFAAGERTLGPHTLNVAGDYELIDLHGPRAS
jgi:hypothetical protein